MILAQNGDIRQRALMLLLGEISLNPLVEIGHYIARAA